MRIWWIVVVLLGGNVQADPLGQLPFQSFGVEQGLSNLSTTQIAQTSNGMIWIASEDGLYRYDGATLRHFGVADGLPSDEIRTLLASTDQLWVGTTRGLALVDDHERVHAFVETTATVRAMARAPDGSIWAATVGGLIHQQGDHFEPAPRWPGGPSSTVWVRDDGRVIAGLGSDLAMQDGHGRWLVRSTAQGFGRERIDAIARTADGTMWVRSPRYLWACDVDLLTCRELGSQIASASQFGRLLVDHAGTLWVPTHLGLMYRLPSGAWESLGSADGLPAATVLHVFEDREGSLWFGADKVYHGLGRGLWRSYTTANGLLAETVWTVLRDARGVLWIGGNRGLMEAVETPDRWRLVPGTEQSSVMDVVEGEPGALYFGNDASEVMRVDRATHEVRVIGLQPELGGDSINALAYDHGTLWVAQNNGGLGRFADVAGTPTWRREPLPGGRVDEDVASLLLDRQGRLWSAGTEGLAVRDGERWRRFTRRDGLIHDAVSYLVERASGEICVGYTESGGVTCFRYGAAGLQDLHHLQKGVELTSDKVYALGEDRAGRFYVASGIGVDVIDGASTEHFSTTSGLAGDDSAANAFWADPDGDVWIGSTRGVSRFASGHYHGPPPPPDPVLLSLNLGGNVARADAEGAHRHVGTTTFAVSFATPTFVDRSQLEVQVRLLPFDDQWRTTTLGEARYAQLPPERYVFEVRSRLGGRDFGLVARVAFTVAPAWWQTTWFRGLLGLLALALIGLAIVWRARVISARAARQIVARSEASFRALIEQSPDAVLVHRADRLIYVNPTTLAYLGHATDEALIGCALFALIHPDDHHLADQHIGAGASSSKAGTLHELRMLRRDGSTITVEVSTLSVDFGGTPAVLAIARDCTARKTMEGRLIVSDRMASIGTLSAGIAHEVNNPLAYIKANLGQLADELDPAQLTPGLRLALDDAREGVNRVQKIVGDLKSFSRATSDTRVAIDLHRALELALRMIDNQVRHRCQVVRKFGALPLVLGDESRVGQVFLNLLINAVQAFPEGSSQGHEIQITTSSGAHGHAVIEVRDTGRGMSPEVLKRVFDPFFTTKAIGEGTGLGLAICLGIVHEMGGELTAESSAGMGSVFRVTLPPTTVVTKAPATPTQVIAPIRARVLLIDDDERVLGSLRRMLDKQHDVTACALATEALALIEAGHVFDVIVSDVMMAEMTGIELHAALQARAPQLAAKMVFMTGGAFTDDAKRFLELMADRYIEKPFDRERLRRLIQDVVASTSARDPERRAPTNIQP